MTFRGVLAALAVLSVMLLAGCSDELISNLTQRQANQAVALLQRYHIQAQKRETGKNRYAVYVDKSQFSEAVSLLDEFQVPSRENLEIADLFPINSLVNSPGAERARLISGIEQRLEQTARALDHVLSARVHISYPMGSEAEPGRLMRVSMVLIRDIAGSDPLLIQRMKTLIKNSLESVSYENIAVEVFYKPVQALSSPVPNASVSFEKTVSLIVACVVLLLGAAGAWAVWRKRQLRAAEVQSTQP